MSVLIVTMVLLVVAVGCIVYWRASNEAGKGFAITSAILVGLLVLNGAVWFTVHTKTQSEVIQLRVFSGNTISAYIILSGEGGADAADAIRKYNSDLARLKSYNCNWLLDSYYADVPSDLDYLTLSVSEAENTDAVE